MAPCRWTVVSPLASFAARSGAVMVFLAALSVFLAPTAAQAKAKKPAKVGRSKPPSSLPSPGPNRGDVDERGEPTAVSLEKVEDWLHKRYPGRKWQTGPLRLRSPDLSECYPGRRFWAVHSSPPMPGGAQAPVEDDKKIPYTDYSALIEVDRRGQVSEGRPLVGRFFIADKASAQRVGAALLSLTMGPWAPPSVVQPGEVTAERTPGYWLMTAAAAHQWVAQVRVSTQGQVVELRREYAGPLPP